jgi:hypothetical protein
VRVPLRVGRAGVPFYSRAEGGQVWERDRRPTHSRAGRPDTRITAYTDTRQPERGGAGAWLGRTGGGITAHPFGGGRAHRRPCW